MMWSSRRPRRMLRDERGPRAGTRCRNAAGGAAMTSSAGVGSSHYCRSTGPTSPRSGRWHSEVGRPAPATTVSLYRIQRSSLVTGVV